MPVQTRSTDELCKAAGLGDPARTLLREGMGPKEYLAVLIEQGLSAEAVRFLAHSLPKRESVWWAWVSARRSAGANPPALVQTCLSATERWIAQPTDEHRRAALKAAEAAAFKTAAGCAGLAAFLTGGSLAPAELPPVPPDPNASGKAVAGAVILAAVAEPASAEERFREFLTNGLNVVERIKLW